MAVVLAALDSTPGQVAADGLLVVVVVINMYLGLRHGLLRRLVAFAGVYLGCFAATNIGNGIAALVHPHSLYANAWSFLAVLTIVAVASEVLGHIFMDKLQWIAVVLFDRLTGFIVGGLVGLAEVLLIFMVAISVGAAPSTAANGVDPNRDAFAKDVQSANLSGLTVRLEPQVRFVFAPALPGDLSAHLAESLNVATPPH